MSNIVPKMDLATEARLLRSLEKVASLVDQGNSPNVAFEKIAREDNLLPGHINFLVQVFNTSAADTKRSLGETRLEKAAKFELASSEDILRNIVSVEKKASRPVSTSYLYAPPDISDRDAAAQKRAAAQKPSYESRIERVPPTLSKTEALQASKEEKLAADHRFEEMRRELRGAMDAAKSAIRTLETELRTESYRTPMREIHDVVCATMGKTAAAIVGNIAKRNSMRLTDIQEKKANRRKQIGEFGKMNAIYDKVAAASKKVDKVASLYAKYMEVAESRSKSEKAKEEPNREPTWLSSMPGAFKQASISGLAGATAGGVASEAFFRDFARQVPGMKPISEEREDVYMNLADPFHEQRIRDIRAEAVLNDVMANDQVVSQHSPYDVLNHYNEIVNLAPHLATNPAAMRTTLRRRLQQGAMDSYDVESILKMEDLIKKQERPNKMRTEDD